MSRFLILLIGALALAGASASTVGAAATEQLHVEGYSDPLNLFSSTAGPLCASGTLTTQQETIATTGDANGAAFDLFGAHWNVNAWNNRPSSVVVGTTTFSCPDGTLTVAWHTVGDPSDLTPPMSGRFKVVGGTGAYAGLEGDGAVSWNSTPVGFFFVFDGQIRSG